MKKTLLGVVTSVALLATPAVAIELAGTTTPAAASTVDSYTWKNVPIVGGGFIAGIVFNQKSPNLAYARTDIGGAYRWDQTNSSWIPLLDWVGHDNWGLNGAASIATDAADPNKVYVAAGMYTNSWDPNNGAILRSADKGASWAVTPLPFKIGGNMPGRGMGERLAVDPNNDKVLYLGAPSGNGLWRSTDSGVTWAKVVSFPNVGNYVQDAGDPNGYLSDDQGVTWVSFDPSTGTAGSTTQGIYVGVADLQNTVYRSTDGGSTWSRITGEPTGFLAHQGQVDPVNHLLYIATSDKGGPYDGGRGDVWKYAIATGTWTQISPVPSSDTNNDYFGYSGLSVDRTHPNTLMVTGYSSWYPDTYIFRSTDGGTTWKKFYEYAWPNRGDHYTLDVTASPWLTFGDTKSLPEETPKLGWMTEALAIDPFNSDRFMFGTGATLYGSTNVTALDSGGTVKISVMAKGLEETAVNDLISPASGAPLISALGDVSGFRHTTLDAVPAMMMRTPFLNNTSIDFAETNPNFMVRVGNTDKTQNPSVNRIGISFDNGADWFQGNEIGGMTGGGTVAVAASGTRIVWAPDGGAVSVSNDGNSWTASSGLPAGAQVRSDRVNPSRFYAFSNGRFYTSTNAGASFAATAATGLPSIARFHALSGVEGDIWLAGSTGVFHSTDGGASFGKVAGTTFAENVGFGKAAPGSAYPAVFAIGTIDGVAGVFRSDNAGANWTRVNDDQHQYGNIGQAITGDPRVYGRVYLGTNGRGILVADRVTGPTQPPVSTPPTTTSPPPTSTPPPTTTNPPTTTPPSTTPPTTSPPATGLACSAAYTVTNQWPGGFQVAVDVRNTGTAAVSGWTVTWTFANGQSITQLWNGTLTATGSAVTVKDAGYNGALPPAGSASFGFTASWNGTTNTVPSLTCTAR